MAKTRLDIYFNLRESENRRLLSDIDKNYDLISVYSFIFEFFLTKFSDKQESTAVGCVLLAWKPYIVAMPVLTVGGAGGWSAV